MALQPTARDKRWIVSVSSECEFAHNMKQLFKVSCVLNAMPHFSFSDESELQVQEFLYWDKLQLCSCVIEVYVEFIPLYGLYSLPVNFAKIAIIMYYSYTKFKHILPALTLGLLRVMAHM